MTVFMMCLLTLVLAAFSLRSSAISSALLLEIFSSYIKKNSYNCARCSCQLVGESFYHVVTLLPGSSDVDHEGGSAVFCDGCAAHAISPGMSATSASEHPRLPPPWLPQGRGKAAAATCTAHPGDCEGSPPEWNLWTCKVEYVQVNTGVNKSTNNTLCKEIFSGKLPICFLAKIDNSHVCVVMIKPPPAVSKLCLAQNLFTLTLFCAD